MSITEPSRKNSQYGDIVILWSSRIMMSTITLAAGKVLQNKYGMFRHDDMVGKPFGSKIKSWKGKDGWLQMLRPSPEMWTRSLTHRTQILYEVDISMIQFYLDLKPGMVVFESGTGSGSLSTAIARTIAPHGHLYTFEISSERFSKAQEEFASNKLDKMVTVTNRDVCKNGFGIPVPADAIFLDLPSPWEVVKYVKESLKSGGLFCSFSPCIEQVQKTCKLLRESECFVELTTKECLLRAYDTKQITIPTMVFKELEHQPKKDENNNNNNNNNNNKESKKRKRETGASVAESESSKEQKKEETKDVEMKEEEKKEIETIPIVKQIEQTQPQSSTTTASETKQETTTTTNTNTETNTSTTKPEQKKRLIPQKESKMFWTSVPTVSDDAKGHTGYLTFARRL